MGASCNVTISGGAASFDKNDQNWRHNDANKATVLAATFDYTWDLLADAAANKGALKKQKKFNSYVDGRGKTHPTDKTWPANPQSIAGATGSKAWADFKGKAVVHHGAWWNHWEVTTRVDVDTLVKGEGFAKATAAIADPWKVKFPATKVPHTRNLMVFTVGLGGSLDTGGGMGFRGSMGRFGVSVSPKSGAVPVAKLAPGWKMYLNVAFKKGAEMKIPAEATNAQVKAALIGGFNSQKGSWKLHAKNLRITFTKDMGSKKTHGTCWIDTQTKA